MNEVENKTNEKIKETSLTCGIIMPVTSTNGYVNEHWFDVKHILFETIKNINDPNVNFVPRMVNEADDIGVRQKNIINNIYYYDIVICDISGKNPDVMFELGMRLAFDKPTIIIKDDKTDHAFETGILDHIEYPHDLRFTSIITFREKLAKRIKQTYEEASGNPEHYSAFLKHFGNYTIAKLDEKEISSDTAAITEVLNVLNNVQSELSVIRRDNRRTPKSVESSLINNRLDFNELTQKLIGDIKTYMSENNIDFGFEIEDREELFDYLLKNIKPFRPVDYFPRPEQFREYLDFLIDKALM
ncbi:hypothetical protein [Priestia megaterium]|uniref:hypothetical protein n=1 Tax=Priestia megaterium TaxID=1404 RepID=UPI0034E214F7